ncbi:ion channel [Ferruginibacter yonginensis]|uniref:Ion channel n=1 Tax=Ferruginibacter yonginensis TaxID=1310416 RepID=A0ABV8QMA8_9BACT
MAFTKKIKIHGETTANTGFGTNAANYGGRFLNKDGSPNIKKTGIAFLERYSWFHTMLTMSRWRFFFTILFFYISVNLIFTFVYYLIGVEHLAGLDMSTEKEKFMEAFFFSTQTYTTVGYGRISPTGFLMNVASSFHALIGLLSFAVATGLMYGRFSRPKAYIKFSDNALISPYKDGKALMVRLTPFKNTSLSDAEVKLTLVIVNEQNGTSSNQFFSLPLEISTINTLTLSWTLVHPITEESPLYSFTEEDFKNIKGELIIYMKAFDDLFSNTVITRSSFTFEEFVYGAKYKPMFHRDHTANTTVLELDKLSDYDNVTL